MSNSLLNAGLVSTINITLGHNQKEPPGATSIWKVLVNVPVPFRSQSTQSKDQTYDKSRCVWCNKDGKYESLSSIERVDAWHKFKFYTVYIDNLDLRHRLNKMITVIDNTSEVWYGKSCWKIYTRLDGLLCDYDQNSHIHNAEIPEVKEMF